VVIDPLVCYRDAGRSAVRHGGLVNACTAGDMDVFDALLMVRAAAAAGRVMSRALCVSVACGAAGIIDRHAGRVWQDVSSAELGRSASESLRLVIGIYDVMPSNIGCGFSLQ
jgi:hypothetical protein